MGVFIFFTVVLEIWRPLPESSTRNDSYIHKVCACHSSSPIEQISSKFIRTRILKNYPSIIVGEGLAPPGSVTLHPLPDVICGRDLSHSPSHRSCCNIFRFHCRGRRNRYRRNAERFLKADAVASHFPLQICHRHICLRENDVPQRQSSAVYLLPSVF